MQEINMIGKKKPVSNMTMNLFHFDGTATDEVGNPVTLQKEMSYLPNKKFGKKGATFTSVGYLQVNNTSKMDFSGDLTIEFIATINAAPNVSEQMLLSASTGTYIDYLTGHPSYNNGRPCIIASFSPANDKSAYVVIDVNWLDGIPHHFAMVRKNNVATFYSDGVLKGTIPTAPWVGSALIVGNYAGGAAYGVSQGTLQELRISKVVRYTAPFTPPVAPFVLD